MNDLNIEAELVVSNKSKLDLDSLAGIEVNGHGFEEADSDLIGNYNVLMIKIPETFRFETYLVITPGSEDYPDEFFITVQQYLLHGPEAWMIGRGLDRVSFRDPDISNQIYAACNELVKRGICKWSNQ